MDATHLIAPVPIGLYGLSNVCAKYFGGFSVRRFISRCYWARKRIESRTFLLLPSISPPAVVPLTK